MRSQEEHTILIELALAKMWDHALENKIFSSSPALNLFLKYKNAYLKINDVEKRIEEELDRIGENWFKMKKWQREKAINYVSPPKGVEELAKKFNDALKNGKYDIMWCDRCCRDKKFVYYEKHFYVCENCCLTFQRISYNYSYGDENRVCVKQEKEIKQVIQDNFNNILFKCNFKNPITIKGFNNIGNYLIEKDLWNKTISEIFEDPKIEKTISMINFIQSILLFNKKKLGDKIMRSDNKIIDNIDKISEEYNKKTSEMIRYDYLTYLLIKKRYAKLIMISMFPNLKFPTNEFVDRVLNNNSTITKEWRKNADVKYQNLRRETNKLIGRLRANNHTYDASIMNYITKRNSDQKQQDKEQIKELKRKNKLFRGLEFEKQAIRENIINVLAFNTNSGSKTLAELFYKEITGEISQSKLCDRPFDESESLFERTNIKTEN